MMCRVLFTKDGREFNEPYLTPPPPWQKAEESDLENLAIQAIEHLVMERQRRSGSALNLPDGYQIVNERNEVIKAETVF